MNSLQKTLLAIGSIAIIVLCYFLFLVKYDRFGQSAVSIINEKKYLVLDKNSYQKLEDKKTIKLHNPTSQHEVKTKNSWQYVEQSKLWISSLETYQDINEGNYTIFLTKQTIWSI